MARILSYDAETQVELVAAETMAVGQLAGIDASGTASLADADGAVRRPIGVVKYAVTVGQNVTLVARCVVGGLSSITPGAEQYLSTTAGGRTQTITTSAPVVRVGKGLTSTSVLYDMTGQLGVKKKWLYTDFQGWLSMTGSAGPPLGAAQSRNTLMVEAYGPNSPIVMEQHPIGAQALLGPVRSALGLEVTQDEAENDGVGYSFGDVYNRDNPAHFQVGVDGAFYAKAKFKIVDASGVDWFGFGFRKIEACAAAPTSYDELACLNVIGGENPANINVSTILNGAGSFTSVDTTDNWADNAEKTLEVYVSAAGVATFKIDGAAPTVNTATFTFDDGEKVMPFFEFRFDASAPGDIHWETFECGLQTGEVD